jgi:hypothetical protein
MTRLGKIARLRAGFRRLDGENRKRLRDLSLALLSVQGSFTRETGDAQGGNPHSSQTPGQFRTEEPDGGGRT